MELKNPAQTRVHRQIEAAYMEALADLTVADDFVGQRNYPKAIETLDYALESLQAMRAHLLRMTERNRP